MRWTFQGYGMFGEWVDASKVYTDTLAEAIEDWLQEEFFVGGQFNAQ